MTLIYISDTNIWIDFRNAGLLEQMFRLPSLFAAQISYCTSSKIFRTTNC